MMLQRLACLVGGPDYVPGSGWLSFVIAPHLLAKQATEQLRVVAHNI